MRPFIITGCARSGMAYTAKLLTAAGVPCTHEEEFSLGALTINPVIGQGGITWLGKQQWPDHPRGESSWLAAPLLDKLPEDVIIFHQLRNPLHVIRSLMRTRFFHPDRGAGSNHTKYARRWMDQRLFQSDHFGIEDSDPPLTQCMKYWIMWNQFAFYWLSEPTVEGFGYRVEDLSTSHFTFPRMLKMITGSWVPSSTDFFSQVPTNTNRLSVDMDSEADNISWDDLPEIQTKRALEQMASAWGYGKEDLSS